MKNFTQWFNEATNDIVFAGIWKDGTVIVYIRGKKYKYLTDGMHYKKWTSWSKYAPGKVLGEIRELVKNGHAQQIEPPVRQKKQKLQSNLNSCPNCRTPEPHYISGIECPGCGLNTSEEN